MEKRIAIVTGVSRLKGIGKTICTELASHGIDIFFTYWRPYDKSMPWGIDNKEPDLIQKEILSLGVRCEKLEIDLADERSTGVLFNTVQQKLGTPTILINNATYSTATNLYNLTVGELDKHYAVNVKAVMMLTASLATTFKGRNGRIINMTSGQSLSAMNEEIAYAVTKAAIETFTRTMQHELALKDITINSVNPGLTDSGWMNSGTITTEQKEIFLKRFPKGRFGLPEDAAKLIAFLVSEDAGWITGQIIHSEGGFMRESYNA